MVKSFRIENFKSIESLNIELGQFNVFIGENGGGKTNLLESIAFAGSILYSKNDAIPRETLNAKGFRYSDIDKLYSLFKDKKKSNIISFSFQFDNGEDIDFILNRKQVFDLKKFSRNGEVLFDDDTISQELKETRELAKMSDSLLKKTSERKPLSKEESEAILDLAQKMRESVKRMDYVLSRFTSVFKLKTVRSLNNFVVYSPKEDRLRKFDEESQLSPLGSQGDGLFKELKRIYELPQKKKLNSILESLFILDWFNGFKIDENSFPGETVLHISDKYIDRDKFILDHRSTNEGFMFLLFYLVLFVSEKTPNFFAIDNVESSFNPKLCSELSKRLVQLSKDFNKQVLITTHSPYLLDGLNLLDDNQRLFVVRRDLFGHTIINRVKPKGKLDIKLSEAWMRGYLGGLPNNF